MNNHCLSFFRWATVSSGSCFAFSREACVLCVFRKWTLPAPRNGSDLKINWAYFPCESQLRFKKRAFSPPHAVLVALFKKMNAHRGVLRNWLIAVVNKNTINWELLYFWYLSYLHQPITIQMINSLAPSHAALMSKLQHVLHMRTHNETFVKNKSISSFCITHWNLYLNQKMYNWHFL